MERVQRDEGAMREWREGGKRGVKVEVTVEIGVDRAEREEWWEGRAEIRGKRRRESGKGRER